MYKELILQIPDSEAVTELVSLFKKALDKYACLLGTDDSYCEMQVFFLELLHRMCRSGMPSLASDGQIVNYISKSLKNHYIHLSKINSSLPVLFSELSPEAVYSLENICASDIGHKIEDYLPLDNKLTEFEYSTLILIYRYGYSSADIAKRTGKSRQAINQAKLRAISKIRSSSTPM